MAQVPYEFLVRFDHITGEYKGAHVKLYDNVTMREGDAQAVGGATGFPIGDILTAIEQGSILAADNALTALNDANAAHAAAITAKDDEIAALTAQLQAATVPAA